MKKLKWWLSNSESMDIYTEAKEAAEKIKLLNCLHKVYELIDGMLDHIQVLEEKVERLEKRVK